MKNKKVFPTLLLAVTLAISLGSFLASNKNVYRKVDAAVTSYKTVYLYVPNNVTDTSGKNPITWDTEENNVKIYKSSNVGTGDVKFETMTKIQNNLYFYTLSNEDNIFYFRTTINSKKYYGPSGEAVKKFEYSSLSTSSSMLELQHYGYGGSDLTNVGTWSNPATVFNLGANTDAKAAAYAHAFITVLETGVCNGDSTDYTKLKSVWNGLGAVYSELNDNAKAKLLAADKEDNGDPLKDFAAKYDYIYWKYGSDPTFTKFINRSVTPRSSTYNPVVTDSNTTNNIIVVSSISLVSLSIIGIYFYIRKRKEDK